MTGNVSRPLTLDVDELVLDPRLQGRVKVDDDVVAEYAEVLGAQGGDALPPIRVVLVDGQPLVVDGWHRALAHKRRKLSVIQTVATEGTWRDALLAAAGANADHGLRRSRDDKRRAVRLLLQDAECVQLSTRDLARHAGVSHTFVGQVRKHYQLDDHEVLTDDRIELLDGELPPRWAAVLNGRGWLTDDVRRIRAAKDLDALTASSRTHYTVDDAVALRLEELATDAWPWDDDVDDAARVRRAARLGTVPALRAALQSTECPDRLKLWKAYSVAGRVHELDLWRLRDNLKFVEGREVLEDAVKARMAELEATSHAAAANRINAVLQLPLETFGPALEELSGEDLSKLVARRELGAERAAALRTHLEALGVEDVEDCPDPRCGGWSQGGEWCVLCHQWQEGLAEDLDEAMKTAGELVAAGRVLEVAGVGEVDVAAVYALVALRAWAEIEPDNAERWLEDLPIHARSGVSAWLSPAISPTGAGLAHRLLEARS